MSALWYNSVEEIVCCHGILALMGLAPPTKVKLKESISCLEHGETWVVGVALELRGCAASFSSHVVALSRVLIREDLRG